jgi:hypothetical protein
MGTKRRVIDEVKFDPALVPTSIASGNATGRYFPMKGWRKAAFICTFASCDTDGTVKLEVFQGKTKLGTGGVLIAGATATSVALTGTQVAVITLATFLATQTITITPYINGVAQTALVYTAHATVTTIASRQFKIDGDDTADAVALISCLNDPTYGVPGCWATSVAGAVTLTAIDDITTIKIASAPDDGTGVKSLEQGELIVEVDASAMTWASGFDHLAAKVTTSAATVICGVTMARFGRFNPVQQSAIAPVSV